MPVHQDFVMGEQPIPLVDLVTRAKVMDAGTDLITVVAIYAVSLLATTGFVVSAVVEEVRRPRRFRQTSSRAKT